MGICQDAVCCPPFNPGRQIKHDGSSSVRFYLRTDCPPLRVKYEPTGASKGEKTMEYGLFPLLVAAPLSLIGWIESTTCSWFAIHIGGHLIYDAYIPISIILYYQICWYINHNLQTTKSKQA